MPNRATDEPSAPVDRFLTTPIFAALLAVILLLGGLTAKQHFTIAGLETQVAKVETNAANERAAHAEVLRDLAQRAATVATLVREREGQFQRDTAANDETHRKETSRALAEKDRLIADLRSGAVQLREEWRCEVPTGAAGDHPDAAAAAGASREAAGADLRAQGAAAFIEDGAVADAWIRWLQVELIATRAACGVALP